MKGDEIADEASSTESDVDKLPKEMDGRSARDVSVEDESNLEDPMSSETTSSDQQPSSQTGNAQEIIGGSKLISVTPRNPGQQCYW